MNNRQSLFHTFFIVATLSGTFLISANYDTTSSSPVEKNNVLIDAIKNNDSKQAINLISCNTSLITEQDINGWTALHWAVFHQRIPVVHALATHKTILETQNNNGLTPLCIAAENGSLSCLEILVNNGASMHNNEATKSPIYLAATNGHIAVVQWFLEKNAFTEEELEKTLERAASKNHWKIVELLLDAGAKPYNYGCGTLRHATIYGNLALVIKLLEAGANPNELNGSPLQKAAKYGYTEIVHTLLAWKADPNSRNYWWKTPLHFAAENGHPEIVLALVRAGANVNVFEWGFLGVYRETPLHKAANEGHIECARILLAAGAEINTKDIGSFEETALTKAQKHHRTSMVTFLLKNGAQH